MFKLARSRSTLTQRFCLPRSRRLGAPPPSPERGLGFNLPSNDQSYCLFEVHFCSEYSLVALSSFGHALTQVMQQQKGRPIAKGLVRIHHPAVWSICPQFRPILSWADKRFSMFWKRSSMAEAVEEADCFVLGFALDSGFRTGAGEREGFEVCTT